MTPLLRGELVETRALDGIVTHKAGIFATVATHEYPATAEMFDVLWQRGYKVVAGPYGPAPGPKGQSWFITVKER